MSRSEKARLNEALIDLSAEPESLYFRQNTGQAWQGEQVNARAGGFVEIEPNMVVLRNARPVKFGVAGLGDIGGVQEGFPVQAEIKTDVGRQSDQQRTFERVWKKAGGIYVLARSGAEAVERVRAAILARRKFSMNS